MYAVIETGGKQYRIQKGEVIEIEKIPGELGSSLDFSNVLMCSDPSQESSIWLGKPYLNNALVKAEIVGQGRGKKILIMKYKRKKQYKRTQGHRQYLTQVLVTDIDNGDGKKATLSQEEKSLKLKTFNSQLKAKGLAQTPKTLGSRKRAQQKASLAQATKA